MQDFKNLDVYHEALRLSLNVAHSMDPKLYARYPGKRAQTFRFADSIPSNIAEGAVKSNPEFGRSLDHALASAAELENHLLFAREAKLIPERRLKHLQRCPERVRRMLINLLGKIRRHPDR
jgi:four helix bundle protein